MSFRVERLGSLLKKDLGEIIQKDYQPEGTFVTITNVRVTPDLSIAKVYLSVFSPRRDEQIVYQFIDENIVEIRYKLAGKIKNQVRKIPELHFYADDTSEYVNKMQSLFNKVDESPKAPIDDSEE